MLTSFYSFLKEARLWELQQAAPSSAEETADDQQLAERAYAVVSE